MTSAAPDHPFFGRLDNQIDDVDVIWEREFELVGQPFDVWLWSGPDIMLDKELLDALSELLHDLSGLDARAREALVAYLEAHRSFIDDHVEGIPDSEVMAPLIAAAGGAPVPADSFAAAMRLSRVGLWLFSQDQPVALDYMLDQSASDEILAVKTDRRGRVLAVDWES